MPTRKTILATGEIYHVICRSIAQTPIFKENRDYQRALEVIDFYRHTKPRLSYSHYNRLAKQDKEKFIENLKKHKTLVKIIAFCFMPNHCHFLLKQNLERGI